MTFSPDGIKVIAIDADDTLWDNEPYFRQVEAQMCEILSPYGDAEHIAARLFEIEMANMPDYGYGAVAFTMSLIESAIKVSDGRVPAYDILKIIEAGRTLVNLPATPLPGVEETLRLLSLQKQFQLVVFTKGELLTQENKLKRSGLLPFFNRVVIVTDKKERQYEELCDTMGIQPRELLMVGNSLKSDILPALNIGSWGAFIPYEVMWQHEVMEHFEHEQMLTLHTFSELGKLLLG